MSRGHTAEQPLLWAAHAAVALMLACSLWVALDITPQVAQVVPIEGKTLNLLLASFCLETAFFYALATVLGRTTWTALFCDGDAVRRSVADVPWARLTNSTSSLLP